MIRRWIVDPVDSTAEDSGMGTHTFSNRGEAVEFQSEVNGEFGTWTIFYVDLDVNEGFADCAGLHDLACSSFAWEKWRSD